MNTKFPKYDAFIDVFLKEGDIDTMPAWTSPEQIAPRPPVIPREGDGERQSTYTHEPQSSGRSWGKETIRFILSVCGLFETSGPAGPIGALCNLANTIWYAYDEQYLLAIMSFPYFRTIRLLSAGMRSGVKSLSRVEQLAKFNSMITNGKYVYPISQELFKLIKMIDDGTLLRDIELQIQQASIAFEKIFKSPAVKKFLPEFNKIAKPIINRFKPTGPSVPGIRVYEPAGVHVDTLKATDWHEIFTEGFAKELQNVLSTIRNFAVDCLKAIWNNFPEYRTDLENLSKAFNIRLWEPGAQTLSKAQVLGKGLATILPGAAETLNLAEIPADQRLQAMQRANPNSLLSQIAAGIMPGPQNADLGLPSTGRVGGHGGRAENTARMQIHRPPESSGPTMSPVDQARIKKRQSYSQ